MMPPRRGAGALARSKAKRCLLTAAFAILAIAASGCLPLMVGSLGYEGYEYEKTGSLPGMPKMPGSDPSPSATSQPTPAGSDHDIE